MTKKEINGLKKNITGRRLKLVSEPSQAYLPSTSIHNSKDAAMICRKLYTQLDVWEEAHLLLLNRASKIIGHAQLSQGGLDNTVLDCRIIAMYAILSGASAVIITHNHPSGRTIPSEADRQITKNVKNALELFDIQLIDHIIIGDGGNENDFYSFCDAGL